MDLTPWLNQTVTRQTVVSRDVYGKVTWSAQATIKGRVQPSRKIIKGLSGQEVATSSVLYTTTSVGVTDRFWLPGADTSDANQARTPVALDVTQDKSGAAVLYKVWF